jgi:hypothetical protein
VKIVIKSAYFQRKPVLVDHVHISSKNGLRLKKARVAAPPPRTTTESYGASSCELHKLSLGVVGGDGGVSRALLHGRQLDTRLPTRARSVWNCALHADEVDNGAGVVAQATNEELVPEGRSIFAVIQQAYRSVCARINTSADDRNCILVGVGSLQKAAVASKD